MAWTQDSVHPENWPLFRGGNCRRGEPDVARIVSNGIRSNRHFLNPGRGTRATLGSRAHGHLLSFLGDLFKEQETCRFRVVIDAVNEHPKDVAEFVR